MVASRWHLVMLAPLLLAACLDSPAPPAAPSRSPAGSAWAAGSPVGVPLAFTLDLPALRNGTFQGTASFANPTGEAFWVHPFNACDRLDVGAWTLDGKSMAFSTVSVDCLADDTTDATAIEVPAHGHADVPFQSYGFHEVPTGWLHVRLAYSPEPLSGPGLTRPMLAQALFAEGYVELR